MCDGGTTFGILIECWAHPLCIQRALDAECSEDLIAAIVNMCHVVGGPASGITREEAIAAATFKDELRTYKYDERSTDEEQANEIYIHERHYTRGFHRCGHL